MNIVQKGEIPVCQHSIHWEKIIEVLKEGETNIIMSGQEDMRK